MEGQIGAKGTSGDKRCKKAKKVQVGMKGVSGHKWVLRIEM